LQVSVKSRLCLMVKKSVASSARGLGRVKRGICVFDQLGHFAIYTLPGQGDPDTGGNAASLSLERDRVFDAGNQA
jgi:hypothetical protein